MNKEEKKTRKRKIEHIEDIAQQQTTRSRAPTKPRKQKQQEQEQQQKQKQDIPIIFYI